MSIEYLLDSNVFIQAKRYYYPIDIFPGFWDWLDQEQSIGRIASISSVEKELSDGNDELADWSHERKNTGWFLSEEDEETQTRITEIAEWIVNPKQRFKETAWPIFLKGADPWLIAKAKSIGATLVTQEKYDKNCRKKILIPNVCEAFEVNYINTLELIRITGASFGMN